MYHYIQRSEKTDWIPVKSDELENKLQELDAKKVTILEVTELVEDTGRDRRTYSYKGPLYFDIDCKEDLKLAIESGVSLVDKLVELGVPKYGIRIYASGSKGIHITVDQKYFSSGRPIKGLPLVYKVMAKELYVPGMDFAVYSCGRGNAFRVANVKRHDGNYRVPVLYEELKGLDSKGYQKLVKGPRNIEQMEPTPSKVALLQAMFEDARREVNTNTKPQVIVSSNETLKEIREEIPPCINNLCDWKGLRADKTLNQAALQLGAYINRTGVAENATVTDGLISRMADNSNSSKYDTLRSRLNHIRGSVSYIAHAEDYHFSCPAMRGMFDRSPCKGCPIEDSPEAANSASATMGLTERDDGMYMVSNKVDKMVANFTMIPTDHYMDIPKEGGRPRRVGTRIELYEKEELVEAVVFNESSWLTRSAFMKNTTEGHGVLMFFGSDNDVQAIKGHVLNKEKSMGEILRVHTCGIHREEVSGTELFTYVEPDMSINTNRIQSTHEFAGNLVARPYFAESNVCAPGDSEADTALVNMLGMNQELEIGLLVGWYIAAHLKSHIMALYNQFPVMSVWGSAGSGKSVTVSMISWLSGTDYTMRDSPVNVANITQFAMLEYTSSTTTVPRVLEEYNKSKMRSTHWKNVGEMLKAAWNGESVLRGGLADKGDNTRTGGKVTKIPISAPLVVVSEQELEMPALQERSIRVQLTKESRKGKRQELREANRGRPKLREIGKAVMATALQTTTDEVDQMFLATEDDISEDVDDRPRYCYQTVLVGLRYFRKIVDESLKLPQSTAKLDRIIETVEGYYHHLGEHAHDANARSEIDAVMEEMNIMALMMDDGNMRMQVGVTHILLGDGELAIDPMRCHSLYKLFVRRVGGQVVIESTKSFAHLIKSEPYYKEERVLQGMASGRPCIILDKFKMMEKGLDVSNFGND